MIGKAERGMVDKNTDPPGKLTSFSRISCVSRAKTLCLGGEFHVFKATCNSLSALRVAGAKAKKGEESESVIHIKKRFSSLTARHSVLVDQDE